MEQLHQPRLADLVAERLRKDILSGRYKEGELLPLSGGVFEEFTVSAPAMREAIRVLENEGLVRTRRGSAGGAVAQLPTPRRIGEVIAMVLQARRADPGDVSRALAHIEPICAAMCAERPDRHETVVPALRQAVQAQLDELDDPAAFMPNARAFHEAIVENCGSETMIVAVGALEAIWSAHASPLWNDDITVNSDREGLRAAVAAHERILQAIEAGDAAAAAALLREHGAVTSSASPELIDIEVVDASLVNRYASKSEPRPLCRCL
jgi:DNA-binding FadR family transcriptional regulator